MFELKLDDFGPYTVDYTRNGRSLTLAGGVAEGVEADDPYKSETS